MSEVKKHPEIKDVAKYSLKVVNFFGEKVEQLHENDVPQKCMNIPPMLIPSNINGAVKPLFLPCVSNCPHFAKALIKANETAEPVLKFMLACARTTMFKELEEKIEDTTKASPKMSKS